MNEAIYSLAEQSLAGETLSDTTCERILADKNWSLLPLLDAAFQVRKETMGLDVAVHIINNTQNGRCPEDCNYCAQAKTSEANIVDYSMKEEEEILKEAKEAYQNGAFRYCMVFSGRGPSKQRVNRLAGLIKKIKAQYPIQTCLSAGLIDDEAAQMLKDAGLDRLNHNLNTSENFYEKICDTHTYQDRMNTLQAAKKANLEVCSGMIVGMGESHEDIIAVAKTLRDLKAPSIPVNFLLPIEGNQLIAPQKLTPDFCLRVLCLFRFINPKAEIRIAAGREWHLRSMEVMGLYPANSIFLQGYLNTKGNDNQRTLQMIKDAGFTIKSEIPLDTLLEDSPDTTEQETFAPMKQATDLMVK